ncbi:MAG: class I SAM-dependent methyltransferase [Sneathiella sp.]|nr:class I SAM-dependent methyltransferase [Sneathiella sp.]
MNMRRLRMGLNTILGYHKEGFFIPYRYAGSMPEAGMRKPYRTIEGVMRALEPGFATILEELTVYTQEFAKFNRRPPPEPRWQQDWFPRLDAAVAYYMVRDRKPGRIVEVGSGHSTRFMARAMLDGNLATKLTAIDPAPRAAIETLPVEVIHKTLNEAPTQPFSELESGDFLFIDSSHIAMPGSDVDTLFLEIFPALPAGVYVHIHDIFLPDDYPASWDWRGYNEQLAVAPLFLGGGFDVIFSSAYAVSRMADAVGRSVVSTLPLEQGAFETSLWLRKRMITQI